MSTRPLLSNGPQAVRSEEDYEALQRKVERLQDEIADAKLKIQEERNRSARTLRAQGRLRHELSPLYNALKGVMEELPSDEEAGSPSAPQSNDKWETQKRLFPGKPSEIIDLLLIRSNMSTKELATANRSDPRTITKAIFILNNAGLIEKNAGRFSLKQL